MWLFNEYGQGLRELVKKRAALERFVDFMSYQVFPDATTYTALQVYSPKPRQTLETARAADGNLENLTFHPVEYSKLGEGKQAWALLRPAEQDILDTMRTKSTTLSKAAKGIIVGIQTSADHIYHLIQLGPGRYWSRAENAEVELDDDLLKPLVSGEDALPFATPLTDKHLLFPYHVAPDDCRLLSEVELKRYRRCWKYLSNHETELRAREGGKFDDDQWWRFGRNQSIDKQHLPKLLVPRLLLHLRPRRTHKASFASTMLTSAVFCRAKAGIRISSLGFSTPVPAITSGVQHPNRFEALIDPPTSSSSPPCRSRKRRNSKRSPT